MVLIVLLFCIEIAVEIRDPFEIVRACGKDFKPLYSKHVLLHLVKQKMHTLSRENAGKISTSSQWKGYTANLSKFNKRVIYLYYVLIKK